MAANLRKAGQGRRTEQPQSQVQPADRWLSNGLVYADTVGYQPANWITGQPDTLTGTKPVSTAWGQARGFGATLGVGTTDAVRTNLTAHATNRTYLVRMFLRSSSAGGAGLGRVFDKQLTATSETFYVNHNGGAPHLRFARTFTTGQTEYATQNNSVVNGQSYVLAVTYDSSSPSNAPRIWINGGLQSLTSLSTGTGSAIVTTDAYALGNRPSDSLRNIDGWISDFFVFDSILSNGDIEELSSDLNQIWQDRRIWVPVAASVTIYRPNSDVAVSGWTPSTGATVYGVIDETTLDDADYATSPDLSSASPATMGLTASLAAGTWTVRVRGLKTDTAGQLRINLLDSSNVVQGSSSWQSLTGTYTTYTLSITTSGAATRMQIEVAP